MKKTLFAAFLMLSALVANAQGFGGPRGNFSPEDMAKRQAEQVKEWVGASDEQYQKIYDLYLAQSKQMVAMMDSLRNAGGNNGGFPRFDREAMQKRHTEMNEKIKALLTDDQKTKYDEEQKKAEERRRQRFGQQ